MFHRVQWINLAFSSLSRTFYALRKTPRSPPGPAAICCVCKKLGNLLRLQRFRGFSGSSAASSSAGCEASCTAGFAASCVANAASGPACLAERFRTIIKIFHPTSRLQEILPRLRNSRQKHLSWRKIAFKITNFIKNIFFDSEQRTCIS